MEFRLNELGSGYLNVSFLDEDDVAVVPASITYRIDDFESAVEILDWTNVSPSATITIDLIKTYQTILDNTLNQEKHILTLVAVDDADHQLTEEVDLWIKNLTFLQ